MKNLLEAMEKNPELKAKIEELNKAPDSTVQDFIKAAAEYGVELAEADFAPAGSQGELADDELEAVAGGGACFCAIGGGGDADVLPRGGWGRKTCACVLGGGGQYTDNATRCACVLGGAGD